MKPNELEEKTLREPVDRGTRLVGLSLIDEAKDAAEKLTKLSKELRDGDSEADEALHDFRVGVRRLRSWLRAFKPWLRTDISRKRRRSLSKIADATREARDATVHLEWLRKERPDVYREHFGIKPQKSEEKKQARKADVKPAP